MSLKLKPYKRMSIQLSLIRTHSSVHFSQFIHITNPNLSSNFNLEDPTANGGFPLFLQDPGTHRKHNKKRLTENQVAILENCFASNKKLEPEQKFQLANQLGVPPRQIAIWYQNKRARWKTQSLELDYGALQLKLENVLAEKKRLEKDVERLKTELKKAQEMLLNLKGGDHNTSCEFSTSFEEGGSSGMHDDATGFWQSGEVMQVEELYYAYFMGANGSSLH